MNLSDKMKNMWLVFKDQLPITRMIKNIMTGNIMGVFSKHSHFNKNGQPKVKYNTKESATKAANKMSEKHNVHFSNYKCLHCKGYHIGKNRTSVAEKEPV